MSWQHALWRGESRQMAAQQKAPATCHIDSRLKALRGQRWTDVWEEKPATSSDVRRRAALLSKQWGLHKLAFPDPTAEALLVYFRTQNGVAGADGWRGEEIRHLPLEAIIVFAALTGRWRVAGQAPKQLKEARQANLVKEGKAKQGVLQVEDATDYGPLLLLARLHLSPLAYG